MTHEEFIARAKEVQELDKDLWRQLRSLYVDGGTLQQLVRAILDFKTDIHERMANTQMVTDEAIRTAIGLQGQVLGINNVLALIEELMKEPEAEGETENATAP